MGWKDWTLASVLFDRRQRCAMRRPGQNWPGFMKSATLPRWIASAFRYSSANGEGRHPALTPSARAVFRSTRRLALIWKRSSPTSQSQASREFKTRCGWPSELSGVRADCDPILEYAPKFDYRADPNRALLLARAEDVESGVEGWIPAELAFNRAPPMSTHHFTARRATVWRLATPCWKPAFTRSTN